MRSPFGLSSTAVTSPRVRVLLAVAALLVGVGAVTLGRSFRPATEVADVAGPFVMPSTPELPTPALPTPAGSEPAATPTAEASRAAATVRQLPAAEAIQELRRAGAEPPRLVVDPAGHVRSVAVAPGTALPTTPGAVVTTDALTVATAFVNRYGAAFGLRAGQHAKVIRVDALPGGDRVVRLRQTVGGIPVLGGDLVVAVNASGGVVTSAAETPVDPPAATRVAVSRQLAGDRAIASAAAQLGVDAASLRVREAGVWLYDPRLVNAPGRAALRAIWKVTLGYAGAGTPGATPVPGAGNLATVLIDAGDGSTSLMISEHRTARDRRVCDLNNTSVNPNLPYQYRCGNGGTAPLKRVEGGAPAGIADVDDAYDLLGATYDFYLREFRRDSIDGLGLPMRATVRYCEQFATCPYPNAFWDGDQMVFGAGYAGADDVVGHELTHGVTEHTSELFYYNESGAINEALSDIFGELIDQSRGSDDDSQWLVGEDLPIGAIRSLKSPTLYGDPERVGGPNWSTAYNSPADSNGVHTLSGVANKAAYLISDGGTFNGQTIVGIGRDRSAQLWYRVQYLLPSGAQYHDLGQLLPAACRALVGYRGMSVGDCAQVDKAVLATEMASTSGAEEAGLCPSPGQPTDDLFFDDLESGAGNWTLDSSWMLTPDPNYPLVWAHSGRNALDSYDNPPAGWVAGYARLNDSITVPASGTTYLWYALNNFPSVGFGNADGGGTAFYATSPAGPWLSGLPVSAGNAAPNPTHGYDSVRLDLTGLAGQTIWLAFKQTNTVSNREWLIDDVRVYQCAGRPSAPRHLVSVLSPDAVTVDLSWQAPEYAGPGIDSYEVTATPAIPGLPATLPAGTLALRLTGLDPDVDYQVTVRAVGTGAIDGDLAITSVPSASLAACPTVSGPKGPRLGFPCVVLPPRRPSTS